MEPRNKQKKSWELVTRALIVKARVAIEKKQFQLAERDFTRAIELEPGDVTLLLWHAYSRYLIAEHTLSPDSRAQRMETSGIIRELERIRDIMESESAETKAYILFFLGCFYYKTGEYFEAVETFRECTGLKSDCRAHRSACEWLDHIWSNVIHPPAWKWWWNSPLHRWTRRIVSAGTIAILVFLLVAHPFIPDWLGWNDINWTIYIIALALLVVILLLPTVSRFKAQNVEIELRPPPDIGTMLSPATMESALMGMESLPSEPRR